MSGGGRDSKTTSEIAPELRPLAQAYADKGIGLMNTPWQGFEGQRFADFTGSQQAGLNMMEQRAMQGSPSIAGAETALQGFMSPQGNPFLDAAIARAQEGVMGAARGLEARSGSFGNSGVSEFAAKNLGNVETTMRGNAYEGDMGRALQAVGMAPQLAQAGYMDAGQLFKAGQLRQDQAQQGMDFGFSQFQDQQNKPYKDMAAAAGVFQSQPFGSSTTTQGGGK